MFNLKVNLPNDISKIISHIVNFQTDKLIAECSNKEIQAIIEYLDNKKWGIKIPQNNKYFLALTILIALFTFKYGAT